MSQLRLSFLLPLLAFAILALVGAIALYSTLLGNRDPAQLPSVLVSKLAPQTTLQRLRQRDHINENSITLREFRGQPLLVNFFASWCAPCRAEAPALEHLSNQISIIGIAYKDRPQDTRKFLQQYGNPFVAIGRDNDGRAGMAWGVYGVPETYLIDPSGQIKWRHAGPLTRDVITTQLLAKLTEMQ